MTAGALRQHYLFYPLDETQWARLQPHIHSRPLSEGEFLFTQGEPAPYFYVIGTGGVKLFRTSTQGLEKIMRLVYAGQSFAESALFSDPPRYPVHAQAIVASQLAEVECEAYLALLRESFGACRAVMREMVRRIHGHWDEIEGLSLLDSRHRVARYLLRLACTDDTTARTVRLPARKVLIAAHVGLAPETLSRTLKMLSDDALIAMHTDTIDILDPQGLARVAAG